MPAAAANRGEKIVTQFYIRSHLENELVKTACAICLPQRGWRWRVRLDAFEPLHGMSRVVRLVPDKIATALAILKEGPERYVNDAVYLIELVCNLAGLYEGLAFQKFVKEHDLPQFTGIPLTVCGNEQLDPDELDLEPDDATDFCDVVNEFRHALADLMDCMRDRHPPDGIIDKVLDLCDGIQAATETFCKFVHPAFIACNRRCNPADLPQVKEDVVIEVLTDQMRQSIAPFAQQKLSTEYKNLMENALRDN